MTCWSCSDWRENGCNLELIGFPKMGPRCFMFVYEPGSDEGVAHEDKADEQHKTALQYPLG